jgi:hypothetical protein
MGQQFAVATRSRHGAPAHRAEPAPLRPVPAAPAPSSSSSPLAAAGNQALLTRFGGGGGGPTIRRKCSSCAADDDMILRAALPVSRPHDPEEVQADRLADRFVAGHPVADGGETDLMLHRKAAPAAPAAATAATAAPAAAARSGARAQGALAAAAGSPGRTLPSQTRAPYERFYGTDFSRLRVHDDDTAAGAARALDARAFTRGGDVYFGAGQFDERSTEGRRLIAHELAHVAMPRRDGAIERDGVLDTIGGIIDDPVGSAGRAVDTVRGAAGEAADWLATTAGESALAAADALAGVWGGSVTVRGGCLVVDIPSIPLFPDTEKTLAATPPIGFFVPFAPPAGVMLGPIPLVGMAGLLGYVQGSVEGVIGPAQVRGIQIRICPFRPSSATGEIYAAAAIGLRLNAFGGVFGALGTAIPTTPPIPVVVIAQGGLLATGTGWLIGAARSTAALTYSAGTLSLANTVKLAVGGLLTGDIALFAALRLYDKIICQYRHPLGHWVGGRAWEARLPMRASLSRRGLTGSVGPLSHGPLPIQDLEIAIHPLLEGWSCLSWEEIERFLCENGYIPPEWCDDDREPDGPAAAGDCVANNNLGETADSFISRCRKASIRSEFPGEFLGSTLGEIKKGKSARHKKAWKLLNDNRFKKPGTGGIAPGGGGAYTPLPAADPNRIRVQLQHKSDDVVPSETVSQNSPVTVAQGHAAVDRLAAKPAKSVRKVCKDAFSKMKKTISGFPPTGVSSRGNVSRKWCDEHPDYARGIRLDLENLAGTNFTS